MQYTIEKQQAWMHNALMYIEALRREREKVRLEASKNRELFLFEKEKLLEFKMVMQSQKYKNKMTVSTDSLMEQSLAGESKLLVPNLDKNG